MRSIVIDGKLKLAQQEQAIPEPRPGQVRLRVEYVGICGSDLHYFYKGANGAFVVREPLIPGHELSGRVDKDPSGQLAPGTPVTAHPVRFGPAQPGIEEHRHLWPGNSHLGSASTWPHTQGAMAQYLVVDFDMVHPLPLELPLQRAALSEPLAVVLHGIRLGGDITGAKVLVSGAGPIGLLAAAAARANGAAEVAVSDVLDGPLERARLVGADRTFKIGTDQLPESAFDIVLECSGVPSAVSAAGAAVRPAGRIVQIGMLPNAAVSVNLLPYIAKEVRWVGAFRFDDEIDEAIAILAQNPVFDAVITHVVPLATPEQAFALAKDSQASGKVLVSLWPQS